MSLIFPTVTYSLALTPACEVLSSIFPDALKSRRREGRSREHTAVMLTLLVGGMP